MARGLLCGPTRRTALAVFERSFVAALDALDARPRRLSAKTRQAGAAHLAGGALTVLEAWLGGRIQGTPEDVARLLAAASRTVALALLDGTAQEAAPAAVSRRS